MEGDKRDLKIKASLKIKMRREESVPIKNDL